MTWNPMQNETPIKYSPFQNESIEKNSKNERRKNLWYKKEKIETILLPSYYFIL